MEQTAVEWLTEKMKISLGNEFKYVVGFFQLAKEMEKQQIIDAYQTSHISMMTAEQYYNETFKNK